MWFFKKKKQEKKVEVEKVGIKEEQEKTETKKEKKAPAKEKEVSKDAKPVKYHVSKNKDSKSENFREWRVRKEGSSKTIKYLKTQKLAIEYAETLAKNVGSSVVIHKLDGSIRKQDYSK